MRLVEVQRMIGNVFGPYSYKVRVSWDGRGPNSVYTLSYNAGTYSNTFRTITFSNRVNIDTVEELLHCLKGDAMEKERMVSYLESMGLKASTIANADDMIHVWSPREMPDFVWKLPGWFVSTASCGCVYLLKCNNS